MSDPSHARRQSDAWAHNSRIGLILFVIYLAIYGAFIALSAFRRDVMGSDSLGGVNLAIVYGFGLILGAFLLALVYMFLCKPEPETRAEPTELEIAEKAVEEEGQA